MEGVDTYKKYCCKKHKGKDSANVKNKNNKMKRCQADIETSIIV